MLADWLADFAQHGGEQAGIEGACSLQGLRIDDEIDQCVEIAYRVDVANLRAFQTECLGVTVDAFGAGALGLDRVIERTISIERHAHLSSEFPIEVLDNLHMLDEIGIAPIAMFTVGHATVPPHQHQQVLFLHQSLHSFAIDPPPCLLELLSQSPRAVARMLDRDCFQSRMQVEFVALVERTVPEGKATQRCTRNLLWRYNVLNSGIASKRR